MASINFNASATTALRTLQQTNAALEATQNRVSTGLKIGEAKDNAAYWSISTTLQSDNKTMSTVKDALSMGAGTVDTAYQGLNKSLEVLNEMKSKITAATQPGVDKAAIQAEIDALQDQLVSIADSTSFSGENWLARLNTAATDKTVTTSFTRSATGSVSIGTLALDTSSISLIVSTTTTDPSDPTTYHDSGILTKIRTGDSGFASAASAADAVDVAASGVLALAFTLDANDNYSFSVTSAGKSYSVVVDAATATNAGMNPLISTAAQFEKVLNQGMKDAGASSVKATVSDTGVISWSSANSFTVGVAANNGAVPTVTTTALGINVSRSGVASETTASVMTIDVNNPSFDRDDLIAFIDIISAAAADVTTQAAKLGAVASRIELQTSFVSTLMDTIDKGVSNLIDADLSEESTRLQALQTKQQLGVQALSIANSSTQQILRLFQ